MWRCWGWLHVVLLRGWRASAVSPTGVAVWLHGAPTALPCECDAQRHWDCGTRQPRVSFGASGTCWSLLGGASRMLHCTGVVMVPRGVSGDGSDAATCRRVVETRRTKWTMRSTVGDILLEGKERIRKVWLNDFLWNYFDGRGVVEFCGNVSMEELLISSTNIIYDEVSLSTIKALPPYKELKKSVRRFTCYWRLHISLRNIFSLSGNGGTLKERIRSFLLQGHK
ncbi:putative retrotransposon hot spot protein (RHS) [Trypanosoma cruzi]|uniref:Putative retrotransposon hot spot protein (RHS) n=1 Tax=Trypanosoma cruzi TaxID=5693 RepID=A0A2V2VDU4_TRYCR|nr:putative retrotransposon hot spot protein (RHS) [Trypanosoma cruzi]